MLDLFAGEWSSAMPADSGLTTSPGHAQLFEDGRISWLSEILGGLAGRSVLELGPLEGGHTYMLQNAGAERVVSVEANSRSFLKCLCIKQIFKLDNVDFLYGDARRYIRDTSDFFDVCIASGILYHMQNPVEFIRDLSRVSDTLFIWTHYYDKDIIKGLSAQNEQFSPVEEIFIDGNVYWMSRRRYASALDWAGFSGGSSDHAMWLTRESLFKALAMYGFAIKEMGFDHPSHQNGPSLAIVAEKKAAVATKAAGEQTA
ncbi:MAG: class I SAM-dependent methyltransferase [Hyphomicrobiales bacterium]|nr:class I SAM-dependent methyltransferase [Hyphomicrobiales bacterium]